jgi:sugar phosphate isomerase/epimerase
VFVAASTECLPDLPLDQAIEILQDLEFTALEIDIHEEGGHLKPSEVEDNFQRVCNRMLQGHRLDLSALSVQISQTGEAHYALFRKISELAKATKVVTLLVPSAEQGTPFNEEVDHLQRLVTIAEDEGIRVAIKSQIGRLSEDPDTMKVLCDNVHGLGICFDPSVILVGPCRNKNTDHIMKYVYHVRLRDSKPTQFQVQIGQGEIDYGRIIQQLSQCRYDRALCVHINPLDGIDHRVELRKARRLLDSMLL